MAVGAVLLVAACGDDVPSKTEFTSEIERVTAGRVDPELGECIYDKMVDSRSDLLRRAMSTPDLTEAENEQITNLLAQCIIEREEAQAPDEGDEDTTTTDPDDGESP